MTENLTPPSVVQMIRVTAANSAEFMEHVALHLEKLEAQLADLQVRLEKYEAKINAAE
jgi:hypothetical protein